MNIIKYRSIFLSIAAILIVASIIALAVFGLKPGIDFKGGTMWQVKQIDSQTTQLTTDSLQKFLADEGVKNVIVFPSSDNSYLIRMDNIAQADHQKYLGDMNQKFGGINELQFQSIGPTIGQEIKSAALWSILLVLLGISFYVAYAFRKVSYPIKSWKYGIVTLLTLFHDVIIPAGFFAILGKKYGIEIDTNFVVALLVVMGFSVHDTIVVFDRIRENLLTHRGGNASFSEIVNKSIVQTMARSINTSFTVFIVLLAVFFFGPITLKYFILTLLVGIFMGTYSSIFVASPLLTIWYKNSNIK